MCTNHNNKLKLAADYIKFLGTSDLSPADFQQELYKLGCSVSVNSSIVKVTITLSGLASNFDASVFSHFISDERLNLSGIVFGEILGRTKNNGFELDVDLSLKKGMYMREPFDEMAVSFLYKDGMLHMDDISMTRGQSMGLQVNGIIPVMKDKNKDIKI